MFTDAQFGSGFMYLYEFRRCCLLPSFRYIDSLCKSLCTHKMPLKGGECLKSALSA